MEKLTLSEEGALGMLIAAEVVRLEKEVKREALGRLTYIDSETLEALKSAAKKIGLDDFIESYREVTAVKEAI